MHVKSKSLTLLYDQNTPHGKKALAYAYSIAKKVNKQEVNTVPLSSTFIRSMVKKLEVHPKSLMNKAHPYYQSNIKGRDFTMEGWLEVLKNNTYLLKAPVAINGDRAVLCNPVTRIYAVS